MGSEYMPCWSMHLSIAKEVNKKLKLDEDEFLFGNLLPDMDHGSTITRRDTHYYGTKKCLGCNSEYLPDIDKFMEVYKNKLNNTLIIGYYAHLLTDYYYNKYVYTIKWVKDNKENLVGVKLNNNKIIKTKDKEVLKYFKHHDFCLYGKYLYNNNMVFLPKYNLNIVDDLKYLKGKFYSVDDVFNRFKYLNSEFIDINKYSFKDKVFGIHYKLFERSELDILYKDCIKFVLDNIKKNI